MNITEFTAAAEEKLGAYLRAELQEDVEVRTDTVMKINDQCLHGLSVHRGSEPAPTLYIEDLYEAYERGCDLDDMIRELANVYMNAQDYGPMPAEEMPDMEYKSIKRKVGLRLLGKEYNTEYLKTVPYKDVGNGYVLICDVQIKASDGGVFSTVITNETADNHNYNIDKLFKAAMDNAWRSKSATLRGANELMRMCMDEPEEPDEQETCYVLTTERARFGAAALFYPGTQAMIAHVLKDDYIAIPSSLHEFMIIRASQAAEPGNLYRLVREANRIILSPDEVLSDHILKYSRSTGELSLLPEEEDLSFGFESGAREVFKEQTVWS